MKYLLAVSILLFSTFNALAQTTLKNPDGCQEYGGTRRLILKSPERRFKIITVVGANSGTAREGDYVEFKTLEKIYYIDQPAKVLFDKDTPIFGFVTYRKKRDFPFRRGKIELRLEPLINWNGERIEMGILRHAPFKSPDKPERRNNPCQKTADAKHNCVAGRRYAPVAPYITAIASVGTGTVAALSSEEEIRFVAATSFFSLAKELGNILSGTDEEVAKDDIFDLIIETPSICILPKME